MSKKKVEINKNPLEVQTIKTIKRHNFGFMFVLFAIAVFGAVIFFLPDIFSYYEAAIKNGTISYNNNNVVNNNTTDTNTNTNTTPEPEPEPIEKEITYLTLNTDKKVSFDDASFEDITYESNQISVNIASSKNSTLALSKLSYFMNVYNEQKTLLKTIFFSESVNGRTNKRVSINNAYYYNIVSLVDSDYPYFTLEPDENDRTYLTCNRNQTTIKYTFSDEKLIAIEDKITINNPEENIKNQYDSLKSSYETNNGVTVSITNGNPYIFVVNVDLKLYNGNIKTYYFDRNAYAREIKYKLEAMDFTCRG